MTKPPELVAATYLSGGWEIINGIIACLATGICLGGGFSLVGDEGHRPQDILRRLLSGRRGLRGVCALIANCLTWGRGGDTLLATPGSGLPGRR